MIKKKPVVVVAGSLAHVHALPGLGVELPAGLALAGGAAHRVLAEPVLAVVRLCQALVHVRARRGGRVQPAEGGDKFK
jgi:hypothetical protein